MLKRKLWRITKSTYSSLCIKYV